MPRRHALSLRPVFFVPASITRAALGALLLAGAATISSRLSANEVPPSLLAAAGVRGQATISGNAPLSLAPSTGTWDLSRHESLYFSVRNPGRQRVTVWARAENPEAKGVTDNVRNALVLAPGEKGELRLRLTRRPEDPGYEPFKPFFMYFKNLNVRDNTIDPSSVARVVVWMEEDSAEAKIALETVAARGEGTAGPVPFLPFVDRYGQYKHADWPDKIHSDADFETVKKKDSADMAANPGPADWDKWGGWKNGPKRKATGFFRTEKVDGKWWLVTPDGTLFWSYGPTGVSAGGEGSPVTGKETWFEELPSPEGPAAKYWGRGRGARYMYYEDGKEWRSFSFSGLNAERKYGPDWREVTAEGLHSRLRNWGMNTMANWSDPVVYLRRKTPYVVAVGSGPLRLDHFPDVFDPAFERSVNEAMDRQKGTTAGDPWNLGYFVDNELAWGAGRGAMRAAQGALKATAGSGTKKAFVAHLKAAHREIAALNRAWGVKHASWDALLAERALPEPQTDAFKTDCADFGLKMTEKYFSTVRAAVKRVAPNNLYLGCRFHGHIDRSVVEIAAKHCDVVGYNIYERPSGRLNQYRGAVDAPFIVGEFGVTSDLGQTPWRGQVMTQDQGERLRDMERWLGEAFAHPALVGAHFFQFRDQPLTGRADGEATLRGFINVADTPHFDLVQLNRRLAYKLYETRAGERRAAP